MKRTHRKLHGLVHKETGYVVIAFLFLNVHISDDFGERRLSKRSLFQEVGMGVCWHRRRRLGVHWVESNVKSSRNREKSRERESNYREIESKGSGYREIESKRRENG